MHVYFVSDETRIVCACALHVRPRPLPSPRAGSSIDLWSCQLIVIELLHVDCIEKLRERCFEVLNV